MEEKKNGGGSSGSGPGANLPMQKIKNMMKSNERVAVVSTEAALVMTKAAEHFIGWMTCKAMANKDTKDRKKACLDYQDLTPLLGQHPEQLEFATDLLPLRRRKWEHLGLPEPTGPKPVKASVKKPSQSKVVADPSKKAPAKRSKPKASPADEVPAKRVKSDARHGGIGGLIDAEEENTNRRAVENLIEAARGNLGLSLAEQEAKVQARKKTSSKSKVEGGGGNEDGHGVPGGMVGGSPLRGRAGKHSDLGGLGSLQSMQQMKVLQQQDTLGQQREALQLQLQQRVQQAQAAQQALVAQTTQRLLQQALEQGAQRTAAGLGISGGAGSPLVSSQAISAGFSGVAPSSAIGAGRLQPQDGSSNVGISDLSTGGGGLPFGLASLFSLPSGVGAGGAGAASGFNGAQALAALGALVAAQAAQATATASAAAAAAPAGTNGVCSSSDGATLDVRAVSALAPTSAGAMAGVVREMRGPIDSDTVKP